ncbi:hypothetical protein Tco_0665000 [Tanacetum coccineum]
MSTLKHPVLDTIMDALKTPYMVDLHTLVLWLGMKKDIAVVCLVVFEFLKVKNEHTKAIWLASSNLRFPYGNGKESMDFVTKLHRTSSGQKGAQYWSFVDTVDQPKLNFVEEPVEILEREFKKLKRSRIAIVKVRWNSKRGPEFTWEREDQMKLKYPHLFSDVSS